MKQTSTIYFSTLHSSVGWLTLARTKKGLCRIDFGREETGLKRLRSWAQKHFLNNRIARDDQALADVKAQLEQYFAGKRKAFDCELQLIGTAFQKMVWSALMDIPYGEVRSYKEVAQAIGSPKAVRAVGSANHCNTISIIVPCHRVIGSNGALIGYASGLEKKRKLLALEGALHLCDRKKA